jgi:phage/conjugal plasmid C-4 type zinc finger TraR family protein
MPDLEDLAQESEQLHREASIDAFRMRPTKTPSPDCRKCGDEIPAERRKAVPDCDTCIDCQRAVERRK